MTLHALGGWRCGLVRRGLVVKALDFHAGGRGFDSRTGQTAQYYP